MENGISVADAMALQDHGGSGFMGESGSWVFFLFFLLAWGNGGLFGGRGDGVTKADLTNGFDFNHLQRQAEDNAQGLARASYELKGAIDSCCCATNRNIDAVRTDICNQTNSIVNAIHSEGEQTRALINANTMQALRDENATLKFDISQTIQTRNILNSLGRYVTNPPCPQPWDCGYIG